MSDKKIVDLGKRRGLAAAKKVLKTLGIPIALAAAAAVLFLSARLLGNVAVSNITDGARAARTAFSKGGGFPYKLNSRAVRKVSAIGSGPLTLCDDSITILSASGKERFVGELDVSEPRAVVKNGRVLVYGSRSRVSLLYGKTEKLGEVTESGIIYAAALAKNGSFAVSYAGEENQSVLNAYNGRFKKEFQWNCRKDRITDVSISDDGNDLAAIAAGAENAEVYSRVLIFDAKASEPKADVKFEGTLFLKIIYSSSSKIIAVGDDRTVSFDENGGIIEEISYPPDALLSVSSDEKGNAAILFKELGGAKVGAVRFSKNGKRTYSVLLDDVPDSVAVRGRKTALAFGNETVFLSAKGREIKRIKTKNPVERVFFCGNKLYTVENGSIYKY